MTHPTHTGARARIRAGLTGTATTPPAEPSEPRPRERIAAGIAASEDAHEAERTRVLAATHRPDLDAEADRLAALDGISSTTRMQIGYHDRARKAAHKINTTEEIS